MEKERAYFPDVAHGKVNSKCKQVAGHIMYMVSCPTNAYVHAVKVLGESVVLECCDIA